MCALTQSLEELKLMVTSLKGLSAVNKETQNKYSLLQRQAKTSEIHISVLKSEVATATDFILEQELNAHELGGLRTRLAQ